MNELKRQVVLLVKNGAHGAAVRMAFEAVRRNPAPEYYELLAYAEAMAGYTKAAIKTISQAIELAPHRPAYWFQRGQLHLAGNALPQAVDDMNRVIRIEQEAGGGELSCKAGLFREEALSRVRQQIRSRQPSGGQAAHP